MFVRQILEYDPTIEERFEDAWPVDEFLKVRLNSLKDATRRAPTPPVVTVAPLRSTQQRSTQQPRPPPTKQAQVRHVRFCRGTYC